MGKSSGRKRTRVPSAAAEPPAREPAPAALLLSSIVAALIAVVFVIYSQVRTHGFINFDDPEYVSANPHVLGGLTWDGVRWAFTHIHAAYWIPLTWISHMTDVQLFGRDAGAHLLVSVSLHGINSALLFLFLRKATDSLWRSAAVAALFAVHPMHVESVAWISERKDTLSTLFFLLCLLSYSHVARASARAGGLKPAATSRAAYAASLATLAIGMLAKPMLVSTPIVLLLLDYWPFRRANLRKLLIEKIPFALCIVPSAIATLVAQRDAMSQLSTVPPLIRIANAFISYVRYVGKTFWPANLSIIYPFPTRISPSTAIACAVLLIAATAAVIIVRKSWPWLFVGWCWFVVTLIPVIGLVQVGVQAMADRFTYIPHIGLFVAIVWSCAELASRRNRTRALSAAAVVVIALLAVAAHAQASYWSGNVPLFEHAIAVTSPQNKLAHFNLAAGYMQRGDYEAAQREYELAGTLQFASTGRYAALTRLSSEEFKKGDVKSAQEHLAEALKMNPEDYEGRMNNGTLLVGLNRNGEAVEQFAYAARLHPKSAEPHVYAALAEAKAGRFDAAVLDIQRAIAVDHDGSNRILIGAIRIPPRPTAIDEYLAFLRQQSGGH